MLAPSPVKFLIFTISGIVFLALIVWLWQRQPQSPPSPVPEELTEATVTGQETQTREGLTIETTDNQIARTDKITIIGGSAPNQFIAIYTNDYQHVAKSDQNGNFRVEITLVTGLNLIEIATVPQDGGKSSQKSRAFYFDPSESEAKNVFAGSVKSIFDTLLTVTTTTGDKNVRTSQNTEILIPEDEQEQQNATVKNVRIGDYAIALGSPPKNGTQDADSIVATSIQILRENKPQNFVRVVPVQVITPVRQNLFSAKNLQDQKIIELTLAKNSVVQIDGKEAKTADVTRDKNAIVFYHAGADKNIINLIYLLP